MVRTRWTHTMVMVVCVLTLMGSWASGQTGDGSASSVLAGPWTVDVAPYLWLPVPSGTVTIGDHTAHLSHDLGDTLDLLFDGNFSVIGGMGRVEARKGHLLFTTNVVYLHVDEQEKATALGVKTEVPFNYLNTEFGVGYRLGTWSLPSSVRPSVSVDALAGGRYVSLQPGITVTGPRGREVDVERDVDWLDPYVGGRVLLTLAERFTVRGAGRHRGLWRRVAVHLERGRRLPLSRRPLRLPGPGLSGLRHGLPAGQRRREVQIRHAHPWAAARRRVPFLGRPWLVPILLDSHETCLRCFGEAIRSAEPAI